MTALAELSEALGVRVTGVRRATVHIDGRWQQHPNAWRPALPDARFGLEDPEWTGDGRPWSPGGDEPSHDPWRHIHAAPPRAPQDRPSRLGDPPPRDLNGRLVLSTTHRDLPRTAPATPRATSRPRKATAGDRWVATGLPEWPANPCRSRDGAAR